MMKKLNKWIRFDSSSSIFHSSSKAVYQLVLSIKMSAESNSSQRAYSNDVLEIRTSKNPTFKAKYDVDMDEFP
ncbi:hypothetical protein Y032_0473g2092 [Ancylostoma ceylanicum]|uniref:Uncharacterized protein n=1 Tax=Ancylostoma ceylanicum TaxID=53326 RepID=A0A016WYI1_9BILA|nr:hypothetical protein Y032_0473g2092 [Ancylostoma ceylanicum]